MFSIATHSDVRMWSYIMPRWEGKVVAFAGEKHHKEICFPESSVRLFEWHTWTPPHQLNGTNLREIITWYSRHQCGPRTISCYGASGRGLVLPVRNRPQPPTLHPSESLFTQTGRPSTVQHHVLLPLHVCHSLVALAKGVCVFPDAQVSKSGHGFKTKRSEDRAQPRKPLLLWAVYLWSLETPSPSPPGKNRDPSNQSN